MARQTLRVLAGLGALLLVLFALSTPALAGPPENDGSGYTEDNDTNDNNTPNNVSDEGDDNHPSGKDRSVENGKSGNQGKSDSNPDDSNGPQRCEGDCGEPDKANGDGGTDEADQDRNNGCGNDDDFDDDNNGWCGPKPKPDQTKPDQTNPAPGGVTPPDTVLPDVQERPARPASVLGEIIRKGRPGGPSVLGDRVNAEANPATLPFTGGNVIPLVISALALIVIGTLVLRRRRAS